MPSFETFEEEFSINKKRINVLNIKCETVLADGDPHRYD